MEFLDELNNSNVKFIVSKHSPKNQKLSSLKIVPPEKYFFPKSTFNIVYKIQLKMSIRYCISENSNKYNYGDFVIIDSLHKGTTIGIIVELLNYVPNNYKLGKILSLATSNDKLILDNRFYDENLILKICENYIYNDPNLKPLTIYDVEYQFDRTKLLLYYYSEITVDYSDLIRTIQNYCRCHVKMIRNNYIADQANEKLRESLATGKSILNN